MINGVDISEFNDNLTPLEIKNAGCSFAILRSSGTFRGKSRTTAGSMYTDTYFEKAYKLSKACGLYVGAYHYSTARTVAEGKAEREYMLKLLKGKQFEYPVFLDVEESQCKVDGVLAFCETMEKAGYYVGIYANYNYFVNRIKSSKLDRYLHWLAFWTNSKPNVGFDYGIWQNTSKLIINGKTCDGDISYRDYAEIIKKRGFNGYSPEPSHVVSLNKGDTLIIEEVNGENITFKIVKGGKS